MRWNASTPSTPTFASYFPAGQTGMGLCGVSFIRLDRGERENVMADERDHRIHELERQLRWAKEDNERVWKLLDDALACLRESNNRVKAYAEARVADAHADARVAAAHAEAVAAEEKLARLTL